MTIDHHHRSEDPRRWHAETVLPHEVPRRSLDRLVMGVLVVFWSGFVLLYTVRSLLLVSPNPFYNIGLRTLVAAIGGLLSWLMYRLLERLPATSVVGRVGWTLLVAIPLAAVFAVADAQIFHAFAGGSQYTYVAGAPGYSGDLWFTAIDSASNWIFLFSAWGLLHLTLRTTAERLAADDRARADREAARIAEIRALRYQINPHFLFNCLNSLTALVKRKDTRQAEAMIGELGRFVRFSLAVDPVADVTLASEVEMQLQYLSLEQRRFPDRMHLDVRVDPSVAEAEVPPLILQPLIENVIKHGVGVTSGRVDVSVTAERAGGGRARVVVSNRAAEQEREDRAAQDGFGIGQQNVAARLRTRFEGDGTFVAGADGPGGYRVELTFPNRMAAAR